MQTGLYQSLLRTSYFVQHNLKCRTKNWVEFGTIGSTWRHMQIIPVSLPGVSTEYAG